MNKQLRNSKVIKAIALLLMIGGLVGLVIVVFIDARYLLRPDASFFSFSVAIAGIFILLYGWAIWTGIDLWRGRPQALTWALVLFAIQIPTVTVPGFTYEFHTGFIVRILFNAAGRLGFDFNLGSSFMFYISSSIQGIVLGINLVAMLAFIYLLKIKGSVNAGTPYSPLSNYGLEQTSTPADLKENL